MLERDAPDGATFAAVPAPALKAKNYDAWAKQFAPSVLARESASSCCEAWSRGEMSRPDESERDFRARLQQGVARGARSGLDALRKKYARAAGGARREAAARAAGASSRETEQATGQGLQTAISVGATLVGALLMGRKSISRRHASAARQPPRAGSAAPMKESEDISRAKQDVQAIEQQRQALDEELKAETASLEAAADPRPKRSSRSSSNRSGQTSRSS